MSSPCTADPDFYAPINNSEILRLCSNIGKATAFRVIETLPLVAKYPKVSRYGSVLVRRPRKSVGEPARREIGGYLGLHMVSATHGCHEWTCGWEDGQEAGGVLAVVRLTSATDSRIATGDND